jgi:uncharacterized protein (DUF1015 family)
MNMAEIAPLTPLRYDLARLRNGLGDVVAPPYDVISSEERQALAERSRYNVVRLILPEGDGDSKYARAAELLSRWREEGVLLRDSEPAFYRYDQTFVPPGDRDGLPIVRRGFLALVRLVPFADRIVLPHERTLSGPKEDRLKLFRATRTNLSPGFMLYRDAKGELAAPLGRADVVTEFSTPDGVRHELAKVRDRDAIRAIVEGIARSSLLIADGHHRYETALRYSHEVDSPVAPAAAWARDPRNKPGADPHDKPGADRREHHYFMTFLVNGDDPDLVVFPTHRHVHSLPSFSLDTFLSRVTDYFDVKELDPGSGARAILNALGSAGGAGMTAVAAAVPDGRAAVLTVRAGPALDSHPTLGRQPAELRATDATVLHVGILEHVLGITPEAQAAKTNLWYPQDADRALAELRGGRGQVLFLMNAARVNTVRRVAEAGHVMPQKSTFFYPKVLTGLAIHTLDPTREVHV